MKQIYLTEQQLARLLLMETSQILCEIFDKDMNMKTVKMIIKKLLKKGVTFGVIVMAIVQSYKMGYENAVSVVSAVQKEMTEIPTEQTEEKWQLIADDVVATVYNAEPKQCNADVTHTASMFRLNLNDVLSHRIIAMERTMMTKYGLKYGDVVKIEGTGKWDGEWQIQDTMNKKFAGQNKIDILVPKSAGLGKWESVKVYKLNNPEETVEIKNSMAPQLSRTAAKQQMEKIVKGEFELA
jgi:predicted transcriptional regulator